MFASVKVRLSNMPILLIRHAEAVDARRWDGPDRDRPLTPAGERSAMDLAQMWRTQTLSRVLCSPYARCVATMAPLVAQRGLRLEATEDLAEGSAGAARRLLERVADQFVAACSHGDVIPAVLAELQSTGVLIDDPWRAENASTWRLENDGRWFIAATYVPPPSSR